MLRVWKRAKNEGFEIVRSWFQDEELQDLVLRKGVYPYEYMDSWGRFNETELPPKEEFYSTLKREHISDGDYFHEQRVLSKLKDENMGSYHDLYLTMDTLPLTDVLMRYRRDGFKKYGLDPAHYLTTLGYSWDALLKKTKIELELLTDYDMHMFIEQGIRGGISTVGGKRFARANNPKLSDYDPSQAFSYIMYLDANNLYGWAMSQHLPVGGFKWVRTEFLDLKKFENQIRSWRLYQKKGYILEVDLEYPQRLHDLHNDYPLAPEKSKVPRIQYSRYQQELVDHLGIGEDDTEKLLLTLNDKKNYVAHYRTLQLYLRLGMKLTKVHRAVSFIQTDWMKEYIDFNTQERAKATTKFAKDLYKLMNNSVFGKTMENLRSRVNVRLVNGDDLKTLRKLASDPLLADWRAFGGNLYGLHMRRDHILFNRPIYVGMCVLVLRSF